MLSDIFNLKRIKKEKKLYPNLFRMRMLSGALFIIVAFMICFGSPILFKISDVTGLSLQMSSLLIYFIPTVFSIYVSTKSRKLLGAKIED